MSAIDNSVSKPIRPCTEYNIFFQLERAHILQVRLGSKPSLDGFEAFRPTQPSYAGLPPLPDRYASLVLPYDWHLPGKEKRRNRKHRRTHGAIGFHELSNAIAAAWREVDREVKSYCARVCGAGVVKYKAALKEWQRNGGAEPSNHARMAKAAIAKNKANKAPGRAAREERKRDGDIRSNNAAVMAEATIAEETAKDAPGRALPKRKPPRKADDKPRPPVPEETAAAGARDDFDLKAFLEDIRFEDGAQGDEAPAPATTAGGTMPREATRGFDIDPVPLQQLSSEQFLAAGADVVGGADTGPLENPTRGSFGPAGEVFTEEVFRRSASIVSNELVDMDDDEIIGMWKDGDEADVKDGNAFCQEISPVFDAAPRDIDACKSPIVAPFFDRIANAAKDADGCRSAFGIKGYDVTMEEVLRLGKILEGQARAMKGVKLPVVHHRRRSITACCA